MTLLVTTASTISNPLSFAVNELAMDSNWPILMRQAIISISGAVVTRRSPTSSDWHYNAVKESQIGVRSCQDAYLH